MRNKKTKIFLYLIAIILILCATFGNILGVYATEQKSIPEPEQPNTPEVEHELIPAIELDLGDYQREKIVGETQLLYVTVIPTDADDQTLAYGSSDLAVAKINGIGRITAVAEGSATITVSCGDIRESFTLVVSAETTEETEKIVAVTDIEIEDYEDELNVDETLTLSATVFPVDATGQIITYKSSDTSIATVNSSGVVKGISAGKVTIYISAGDFTKSVPLMVKVPTTRITVNSAYVVLKPDDTFILKPSIVPPNASSQTISYKSLDSQIATVSDSGLIKAITNGNTTIIVSNDDISTAVTIIVNQHGEVESSPISNDHSWEITKTDYPDTVRADEYEHITKDMLKYLYQSGDILTITDNDYTIRINGEDIVNYFNEFYTGLDFTKETNGVNFELNKGNSLCGTINLAIHNDDIQGKYLYLYNDAKGKYYLVEMDNRNELKLDTAGKYMITNNKIIGFSLSWVIVICVSVIILGLIITYIATKKQYWFW